MIIVILLFYKR